MSNTIPMLKSADVIRVLNISDDTLYRMIEDGRLTPMRLRREYRFDPAQVEAIKRGTSHGPSASVRRPRRPSVSVLMRGVKRRFSSAR